MSKSIVKDFPKLECPFKRKLMPDGDYIITPEIEEGYDWVFKEEDVICVEKLDGTNVSIIIEDGQIKTIFNRTEKIPFFNKGKSHISEGLIESFKRGYMDMLPDGQHFGELIGEKINGNPYKIKGHLWIPFETYAKEHLRYKSWGKYPKDFQTISNWFKDDLLPLFALKKGDKQGFVEGVIFYRKNGEMAKLRRDMFDWFKGNKHKEAEKYNSGNLE